MFAFSLHDSLHDSLPYSLWLICWLFSDSSLTHWLWLIESNSIRLTPTPFDSLWFTLTPSDSHSSSHCLVNSPPHIVYKRLKSSQKDKPIIPALLVWWSSHSSHSTPTQVINHTTSLTFSQSVYLSYIINLMSSSSSESLWLILILLRLCIFVD